MEKYYKPSGKFSASGFVLVILSTVVVGCILSALYLKLNQICPIVILCIVAAGGLGLVMGIVSGYFIKIFKIRNPIIALVGVAVGCLIVTYFKWGLYCYWDNQKYYYDYVDDLYESGYNVLSDEFGMSNAGIETLADEMGLSINEMKLISASDFIYGKDYGYEMLGFDEYEFLQKRSLPVMLLQPATLFEQIKDINSEGRWTYSSRPSYSSSSSYSQSNVNGVMLWIVWFAEMALILFLPLSMAYSKATHPFIEYEGDWAEEFAHPKLAFHGGHFTKAIIKTIADSPDYMFTMKHVEAPMTGEGYVKMKLYHSRDYSECYISFFNMTYVPKNRNYSEKCIAKYLNVDFDTVEKLFDYCEVTKPFPETHKYFADEYERQQYSEQSSEMGVAQPSYEDIFDK